MSSNLVPVGSSLLPVRSERAAVRAVTRVRGQQLVATNHAQARAELIQDATTAALAAGANIASMEAVLAHQVPHAAGRLNAIASASTASLVDVVLNAHRGLR
jgi:hypothetical protein